jgi:hypothetical protein
MSLADRVADVCCQCLVTSHPNMSVDKILLLDLKVCVHGTWNCWCGPQETWWQWVAVPNCHVVPRSLLTESGLF